MTGQSHGATPVVHSLYNGDRMEQAEFHKRYLQYPKSTRIELVGGTVYMASPTSYIHGQYQEELGFLLSLYRRATTGVYFVADTSNILGESSEPRPDLLMRIQSEYGGRSQINADGYLEGAPEFIAEIAYSSVSIDFNQKRIDYQTAGVREYLIVDVGGLALAWFDFPTGRLLQANREGVYRSKAFPGLWIHGQGLLDLDSVLLQATLQEGLASREHAAFVKRLARQKK